MTGGFLSKSRYLYGLQCLKYLWLVVNDPDEVPQPDSKTQHLFDQGHLVQQLAQKLFPDGTNIATDDFQININLTRQLLKKRRTLFEAGIFADNIYSRVDILRQSVDAEWDIVEVKSSTKIKDEHLDDLSFQKHCCERQGLPINQCYLLYINNQYVRSGEIDPQQLFIMEDVTGLVTSAGIGIEDRIKTMLETVVAKECPDSPVGTHCSDPYDCPITVCRDSLPDNSILDLYRGGSKRFDLLYGGILRLRDIPETTRLSDAQKVQKWCDANSCCYMDSESIKSFLRKLEYPTHYLDFETFNTAVPLFDGIRPYQHVPFQFSLHIVARPGTEPQHFSYLAHGPEDPRPEFISQLRKVIGETGSIVVYNRSFEQGRLTDLGQAFPEYHPWVGAVCSRLVDLMQPFRDFDYYHPDQRGSASLKAVLPALTGKSYDDLPINNGDDASLAFLTIAFGDVAAEEVARVREALLAYCALDTEGMVRIIERLQELAG